jgi:hypothetical protein
MSCPLPLLTYSPCACTGKSIRTPTEITVFLFPINGPKLYWWSMTLFYVYVQKHGLAKPLKGMYQVPNLFTIGLFIGGCFPVPTSLQISSGSLYPVVPDLFYARRDFFKWPPRFLRQKYHRIK